MVIGLEKSLIVPERRVQELQPWVEGEKHACAISKESDMILCNRRYVLCVCVRREERRETQDRLDEMKILKKIVYYKGD